MELDRPSDIAKSRVDGHGIFWRAWPVLLLALPVLMYGLVFRAAGKILTNPGEDGTSASVPWFAFEAREFARGHIPLWNPHCFCGAPFVADLNSACFYPPNWLCTLLPEAAFINVDLILHVILAGLFTAWWCRGRAISRTGALLAGIVMMFSGVMVMHMGAGHFTMLFQLVWTPLIFLAIDKLFDDPRRGRWVLLGIFAVGMSILSGFVQMVYYVGLLAGLYTALRLGQAVWLARRGRPSVEDEAESQAPAAAPLTMRRLATIAGMALLVYAGGTALSAVQLLPALAGAKESVRANGLSYEMASSSPQAPADFITLFAPGFWGETSGSDLPGANTPLDARAPWFWHMQGIGTVAPEARVNYFGRWYSWECSSFIGIIALALAAFGVVCGARESRRFLLALIVVCVVLALGKYTPLYRWMFDHFPMYGSFRTPARFNIPLTLFVAVLAGAGFDRLRQRASARLGLIIVLAGAAVILLSCSIWLRYDSQSESGFWAHKLMDMSSDPDIQMIPAVTLRNEHFVARTGVHAANTLIVPADLLIVAILVLLIMRRWPMVVYLLPVLVAVESGGFAWLNRPSAPMDIQLPPAWKAAIAELDNDGRILSESMGTANLGMRHNYNDAYGYDPAIPLRYAEFLAEIQTDVAPTLDKGVKAGLNWAPPIAIGAGSDPQHPGVLRVVYSDRLWMLRARSVLATLPSPAGGIPLRINLPPWLNRAVLVSNCQVKTGRDAVLGAVTEPGFDPRQKVILEQEPTPIPVCFVRAGLGGGQTAGQSVTIRDIDTDHLAITADLSAPRILLITDTYAKDWKARSLSPNPPQASYTVMPADYAFRAIPLAAGHHEILLEYVPRSYTIGWIVSLAAAVGCGVAGWLLRRRAEA